MKSKYRWLARGVVALVLLSSASAWAKAPVYPVKIKDVTSSDTYVHKVVEIEGTVTEWLATEPNQTHAYRVEDNYKDTIVVRTSGDPPAIQTRVKVRGPVAAGLPPYIAEGSVGGFGNINTLLVVAIGLVLVALAAVLMSLGKSKERTVGPPMAAMSPPMAPSMPAPSNQSQVADRTITIPRAPDGTLKLLPGRFLIARGADTIKEFRLYRKAGASTVETTIGREPGDPYTHVQLKSKTVSSDQAKIIYSANAGYTLINVGTTNPTELNTRVLEAGETAPLKEGDRITFGEIELVYREK